MWVWISKRYAFVFIIVWKRKVLLLTPVLVILKLRYCSLFCLKRQDNNTYLKEKTFFSVSNCVISIKRQNSRHTNSKCFETVFNCRIMTILYVKVRWSLLLVSDGESVTGAVSILLPKIFFWGQFAIKNTNVWKVKMRTILWSCISLVRLQRNLRNKLRYPYI